MYSLNWIPFGAFVRIAGMDPDEGHVANGFHTRPLWQRAIVLVAGSSMNAVLAMLLFIAAYGIFGQPVDITTTIRTTVRGGAAAKAGLRGGDQIVAINDRWASTEIADVKPGLPAAKAGLLPEDYITQVDGAKVREFSEIVSRLGRAQEPQVKVVVARWDEEAMESSTHEFLLPRLEDADAIVDAAPHEVVPVTVEELGITFEPLQWSTVTGMIRNSPGQPITVTVLRDGAMITKRMMPNMEVTDEYDPDTGEITQEPIPLIGVTPRQIHERLGPLAAVREGFLTTVANVRGIIDAIARMVTGREKPQVMSIVKIAVEIQRSAQLGWWRVLHIGGMISFAIGFLNLLPFPPFDGWKVVYLGYEGIIGRAPDRKKEALINMVGFVAVMFLFVILVFKDVAELVANRAVK